MLKWIAGGAAVLAAVVAVVAIVFSASSKPRMPGDEVVVAMPDGSERRFSYDDLQKRESDLKSAQARLAKQEAELKSAREEIDALVSRGRSTVNTTGRGVKPKEEQQAVPPVAAQTDEAVENRKKAEKLISEMDWDAFSGAMKAQMLRRAPGKKAALSKEDEEAEQGALKAFLGKMFEVSKLLGKDIDQTMNDGMVTKHLASALMKAWGLDLSEEQTDAAMKASGLDGLITVGNNTKIRSLENLAEYVTQTMRFDEWVRTNVPTQYDSYRSQVGDSPFFVSDGGAVNLKSGDQVPAVDDIARFWKETFGLDQSCNPTLQVVANDYYTECAVLKADYECTYGANMSRSANVGMVLKMVDAQKRAEARIGQALPLTPKQSESVKKTSGTFINIFSR